jgi:TIR domain
MARNEIFISYSHRDKRWLEEIVMTLTPLIRKRKFSIWDDRKITVGSKWKREIASALANAKVALLLVSRSYLHSDYIAKEEFEPLLKRAQEEGLVVVWVAIGHSLYEQTEIADYQAANDPARPLNSLSESDTDLELVNIAKIIDQLLDTEPAVPEPTPPVDLGRVQETPTLVTPERPTADEPPMGAIEKIRQALADGRYAWRSIEALAAKAALTPDQTLDLLRRDPEIELGRAKSGKAIARLWARSID